MSISSYWPTSERVSECIRTEAETADEAVLLAVHQPVKLKVRWAASGREEDKTEGELLEALLSENTDGSAVLVPITGPAGVGKSHIIRWLHAQLLRSKHSSRLHIITIPKWASLRKVVELMLEPLNGTEYEHLRRELETAITKIPERDAAALLGTNLSLRLEKRAAELRAELGRVGNDAERRKVGERTYHATNLPNILGDIFFQESLFLPALERIVRRALKGTAENAAAGSEGAKLPQFYAEDLELSLNADIRHAAKKAREYYASILKSQDGRQRDIAVALLNGCIDQALRDVFRFSETLGRKTIEEIVNDIRVLLLKEGKDLVLLIEDFASLSGIQEPLLKLCIAESEREGEVIRATLRTALAVTDGFDIQRDTIMTRAKREWVIQSRYANEAELLDLCVDLAGRYLNAARWGKQRLRAQFSAAPHRTGKDLYGWVRVFEEPSLDVDSADTIKAFGQSAQGFALFPFNRLAIHSLCRAALVQGASLSYNPRIFINAVLQETLALRPLFEAKQFPPVGFKGAVLDMTVASQLRVQIHNETQRGRLASFIVHWCDNPKSIESVLRTPKQLFDAFSLPMPGTQIDVPNETGKRPALEDGKKIDPEEIVHPEQEVPDARGLMDSLDAWAGGGPLPQEGARLIRKLVSEAIAGRIDWNILNLSKSEVRPEWFWIPGARTGNPTVPPILKITDLQNDPDGAMRRAIVGLQRREMKGNWDYPNAEDDYAYSSMLVDRLLESVEEVLLERAEKRLATYLSALNLQSSLIGAKGRENTTRGYVERLFASVSTETIGAPLPSLHEDEQRLLELMERGARCRPELQQRVLELCGCFQGYVGGKVMGLDLTRLELARDAQEFDSSAISKDGTEELKSHLGELGGARFISHVKRFHKVVTDHGRRIDKAIGRFLQQAAIC